MNLQTYATLLLVIIRRHVLCDQYSFNDRFNVKLEELVDLIAKENNNAKLSKSTCWKWKEIWTSITTPSLSFNINTDLSEDLTKRHKVWSRWGKWGDCSVTCGDGIISRRRLCVGGRCAPGEIEEQHRPCTRTPCDRNRKEDFEPELSP